MEQEDGFVDIFQDPDGFLPDTPRDSEVVFHRAAGRGDLTLRLVGSHPLWAHHLWNAAKAVAEMIDSDQWSVRDCRVLELGAGAGLPSIIAALNGACKVVASDFPDAKLIDRLRDNLTRCIVEAGGEAALAEAVGFRWGSDPSALLAANDGQRFHCLLLCDLVFNHSVHAELLQTCQDTIADAGRVLVVFSHHLPQHQQRDLGFFPLAEQRGWKVERLSDLEFPEMFPEDPGDVAVRRTVKRYVLTRSRTPPAGDPQTSVSD